jgi:formate hydrogenlyase transcriptional activator
MPVKDLTGERESRKKAHDESEPEVEERIAELVKANEDIGRQTEECRQVEKDLLTERQIVKSILESINDGVYIANQNYDIEYVNPVIEKEFGPVNGRKCYEYLGGRKEVCPWCKHPEVYAGKSVVWEWYSPRTGKTYELFDTPIPNSQGTVSKLEVFHDITERKRAEKLLRESEERYRSLVETMNEGFGAVDEKGVWTYVNEKFCKMLGYSCDEIIGRPTTEWLDEANREILNEQLMRRRRGEQEPYEIAGTRKDGSRVLARVSPKPLFDGNGELRGSFAVFADITEVKRTEESLRKALSEIEALKDQLETENIYFRQEDRMRHQFSNMVGQSNAFKYVLYRAEQVAPTNATVLILGETGTGKELIAAAIHEMSPRKDRPVVIVNCAALPANLIESELFGREKGAFTGADARQLGRFDIANGTTICLDEIGELPMDVQAKLLRVIQHGEFERLGSSKTVKVDVRIVATTNRNLDEEVRKGRFRPDLFYRLNIFPLTVPPLRQRKDDIPLLVNAFTERFAKELGKQFTLIPKETMKTLQEYDWPGNIRELQNVIERAVILCPGPLLNLADKLEDLACSSPPGLRTLEETEREQILKTLSVTRWRINGKNGAAEILGLNPSTLRARMKKLGIRRTAM